jgi:predicted anti-sigma-YlaC factor YlaD
MKTHVRHLFADWQMKDDDETRRINSHLENCAECKEYYRRMSMFFDTQVNAPAASLRPDPYLPARVKLMAERTIRTRLQPALRTVRWSLAGFAIVAAVASGIILGKNIVTDAAAQTTEDAYQAYYAALAQQNVGDGFNSLKTSLQEDHHQ